VEAAELTLRERLGQLVDAGVRIVDPRQTHVAADVVLSRIQPGSVLHPGTRLGGARCWLGAGAEVGTEGPATVVDAVLDTGAAVASGYVSGAVLLRQARLGGCAHVRAGTLLEEEASTAHAVGLKQTILLSFVTLGSLINFCDCLMAGGTSRSDHSEVGSGYIHFNFTPWGERGDKATPSLIGCVPRGVFLRERRIFLGGSGGLVGPAKIGYGAVAGAGQVVRGGIDEGRLVLAPPRSVDRQVELGSKDAIMPRAGHNATYIGQLCALREWYRQVRLPMTPEPRRPVIEAALENLDACIAERIRQVGRFLTERGAETPQLEASELPACPLDTSQVQEDHVAWVRGLDDAQVAAGRAWLEQIVERVAAPAIAALE
jgi:UDP-N-acetylglucosamine/UDP-N-acetylgalactosamine diphosphorylase